jgi:predicted neuraminidase
MFPHLKTWPLVPFAGLLCLLFAHARLAEDPYFQESFLLQGSELIPECYKPTLLCLPDGVLACAWATGSGRGALDTTIKISFRRREADRWSPPVNLPNDVGYPDHYPILSQMGAKLRVSYATLYPDERKAKPGTPNADWHLMFRESADGGRTWGGNFFMIPEAGRIPAGRMLHLANGDWLLPVTDVRRKTTLCLLSEDQGAYWRDTAALPHPAQIVDAAMAELEPGHLVAFLRPSELGERERFMWRSQSLDSGRTWSAVEPTELLNPYSSIDMLKLGNGHLLLAYSDNKEWPTPLTLAISMDGGKTWPHKRDLVLEQWDNRDPVLAETADGRIHAVYVYRDSSIKHVELNEAWILGKK